MYSSRYSRPLKWLWRAGNKPQEGRGFSLIEIIVVIGVSAIIASIAISYSKVSQGQISLYVETQKIGEMIFRAKSLALATYNSSDFSSCGYGFQIDYTNRVYSLFSYVPSGAPLNCNVVTIDPAARFLIAQTEVLNRDVVFDTTAPDTLYSVLFVPPEPSTFLSKDAGGSIGFPQSPAKIYIKTLDNSAQASITISPVGQVEF